MFMLFAFSIKNIASKVSIRRKNTFISRLHGYWQLKRQSLNGVPLRRATRVSARQMIRSRVRPQQSFVCVVLGVPTCILP